MQSPHEEIAVAAAGLTVSYGGEPVVCDVSFEVPRGRTMAIVGVNGAGKSTLLRALVGLLPFDTGSIELLGSAPHALDAADRARVAYVSERHPELAHARIDELVELRTQLFPRFSRSHFEGLAKELGFPHGSTRIGALSRGQRASVVVSLALAQRPDVLLLDDPTLGLDPLARRRIVQSLLSVMRERNVAIVFATHELADVERVADDVVLLSRGRTGPAVDMARFVEGACAIHLPLDAPLREELADVDTVLHVWERRHGLELVLAGSASRRRDAMTRIAFLTGIESLEPRAVSFEELALAWLASESKEGRPLR